MATIGRLVSGVAHEVNNPLAAILGFTDLLLENPEVPPSAQEDLKIILQETQRTKDIVQDLLSFARQRPVQRELVQVHSVLRQTIKRSEEHTSELQSHSDLVCRLLLEKKNRKDQRNTATYVIE